MLDINFKNFNLLTSAEKELILQWRNSDRVRLKMVNQDVIPIENHIKWMDKLKNDSNNLYYMFKVNDIPIGVFDYTSIDHSGESCECGSYTGNQDYIGYGILLNYLGFSHAFEDLNFKKINISVLKTNKRVYKMHKTLFLAKDIESDGGMEDLLFIDIDSWNKNKQIIENNVIKFYENINSIRWED